MPKGIFITINEQIAIGAMYKEQMKVKAIAETLGLSVPSIYRWLGKRGIQLRSVPNWSKYRTVAHKRNQLIAELAELKG